MILIVDEDSSFLETASKVLNRDRQVFLATDAIKAFEMAQYLGFSVVLVDLDRKGEDGLALIQKMRDSFPNVSIIAISSLLTGGDLDAARKLGVAEILHKPITAEWKPVVERVRARRLRST